MKLIANKKANVEVKTGKGWTLRGDCRALISCTNHEVVISGPRDTGKTIAACVKAHLYCINTPGCQGAIIRKTQKSLAGTVLKTFERVVKNQGVQTYGGASPERYIYPNGSVIWCGGMDNADKVLSSERDFIYVNQTEELSLDDWEKLAGSCSGRGASVAHPQLFGDCNPAGSKHWIRSRAKAGTLKLLMARHQDNPDLYTETGSLTPNGEKRLAVLQALTGVRRKRLYEGVWATAEGAVYDTFDASLHVKVRSPDEMRRWFMFMDEGYTNPAVILLVGADGDERWHVFKEFYERGKLQSEVVDKTRGWMIPYPGARCEMVAVDEAAAGLIADLISSGVPARKAKGRVIDGINCIQNRLNIAGDGNPRLSIDPSCENVINEFESYVWAPDKPKDTPVKENDHAMDALRYGAVALGEATGAWTVDDIPNIAEPEYPQFVDDDIASSFNADLNVI